MKRPRILMTADAVGGVWVFASSLARALAQAGCEVVLVTLGPPPAPHQRREVRAAAGVRLVETDLALEWTDPSGRDIARACETLRAIAARAAPDIVHINGFREAAFGWNAPVVVTAHSCVFSWWRAVHGSDPPDAEWRSYRAHAAAGLAAADVWAAPSRAMRDAIARIYGPARPGAVIANGIAPLPVRTGRRRFAVIAAGRAWDEAKNFRLLNEAAGKIVRPVHFAGPVAHEGRAVSLPDLHALGPLPREDLLRTLADAEIFVAPARYEPFGLGVLEAASCGAALVLSDIPAFREIWRGAAILVARDDAQALAAAVNGLIAAPARRLALAGAARARAARYTLDATLRNYMRLYARAAAPGRGRPGSVTGRQTVEAAP